MSSSYTSFFQTWLAAQETRRIALDPADVTLARQLIASLEAQDALALTAARRMPSLACGPAGNLFIALFWQPLGVEILVKDGALRWRMTLLHRENFVTETTPTVPQFVNFAHTILVHV